MSPAHRKGPAGDPERSSSEERREVRISLDHIGVAVEKLEEALQKLGKLFAARPSPPKEIPREGVRVSFLDIGDARLELLESTRPDGPVARFLARKGAGLHHLSFRVEGTALENWFQELSERGVRVLGNGPREGAEGTRVFFVHPESTGGVLVEFSQESSSQKSKRRDLPRK